MTEDLIKEFIEKIILEKKQDLLSVKMDLAFHLGQKKAIGSENKLRNQLKKEKDKIGEKRNLEAIETLETNVNELNVINQKINELNAIDPQIQEYITYIEKNKNIIIKKGLDL